MKIWLSETESSKLNNGENNGNELKTSKIMAKRKINVNENIKISESWRVKNGWRMK